MPSHKSKQSAKTYPAWVQGSFLRPSRPSQRDKAMILARSAKRKRNKIFERRCIGTAFGKKVAKQYKAMTFHSFGKLPTDIQVEIWKLAAKEWHQTTRPGTDAFFSSPPAPSKITNSRRKKSAKSATKRKEFSQEDSTSDSSINIGLRRQSGPYSSPPPSPATSPFAFDALRLHDKDAPGTQEWWFEPWQLKQRKVFMVNFANYHKLCNAGRLERPDELDDEVVDVRWEKEVVDLQTD